MVCRSSSTFVNQKVPRGKDGLDNAASHESDTFIKKDIMDWLESLQDSAHLDPCTPPVLVLVSGDKGFIDVLQKANSLGVQIVVLSGMKMPKPKLAKELCHAPWIHWAGDWDAFIRYGILLRSMLAPLECIVYVVGLPMYSALPSRAHIIMTTQRHSLLL